MIYHSYLLEVYSFGEIHNYLFIYVSKVPQELELYLAENVYVTDGNLVLRTQYQPTMYGERQYLWTSGWLDSEHKFWQQFGRFEINAKLPSMCS